MGKHYKDGESYRPSNGTEGDWFISKFCERCIHDNPDPDHKKKCEILTASMWFLQRDKEYPKAWQYKNDKPICTEFQKWDWGNDGDPDDPDNPKAPPPPPDPSQLNLFPLFPDETTFDDLNRDRPVHSIGHIHTEEKKRSA